MLSPVARQRLTSCIVVLRDWCASRRLQLNASQTELIWFGTRTSRRQLSSADRTLTIDLADVQPRDVRDGVTSESRFCSTLNLHFKHHVNRIASRPTCFHHLRRLRHLKCHVGVEVIKQLISSVIFSRLNYCNTLLIGLPFSTTAPLQRVERCRTSTSGIRGVTTYAQP